MTRNDNPEIRLYPTTFSRLKGTEWLNDDCINGVAALLVYALTDPSSSIIHHEDTCGIFSSYAFAYFKEGNDNGFSLHSLCKSAKYWKRPVWLIPIHCTNHWVLAIVSHHDRQIFIYDSFGYTHRRHWEADIAVTIC
jgi:Ulp1 family protease